MTEQPDADLTSFDRIGFASGIYFSSVAKQLLSFADVHLPENKDVFYIYTYGAPVSGFLKGIREIAEKKHCRELGAYHCLGFDTFGPFKIVVYRQGSSDRRRDRRCGKVLPGTVSPATEKGV